MATTFNWPVMLAQASGFEAISEGQGISIAVTGMFIVFVALSGIALVVAKLPAVLEALDPWLPEAQPHGPPTPAERTPSDDEKVVAAIGFVLHQRGGG
ncbi:MAG: OadG family protein [Planctomycetota bacterium]